MGNDRIKEILDKLDALKEKSKPTRAPIAAPSPAAEVGRFKDIVEISPKSKMAEYIGRDFDRKEIEWKEACRYLFCNWKVISDAAKEYEGKDIPRELIENPSPSAQQYANSLVANLGKGAEEVGASIRYLSPSVIDGLPGGWLTPPLGSVVLGLVRKEDGMVSPVVVNVEFLLIQSGSGHAATRYNADSDFGAIFRNVLTDASYI